ncbi:MAG: hypothetical protein KAR35_03155, partial [Candidatus Heimdallarchaeota archaeon]|nr:hypothetical protein [Candidatus Heimdallarchaeota archaeon]MCK5048354.1 hypothetical protein [Candidatus Heimdallarchaeota archaeon]
MYDCIVPVGTSVKNAPLLDYARKLYGEDILSKSLIPIDGQKSMVQYVVDAINDSKSIGKIVIMGSDPFELNSQLPVDFVDFEGTLFEKLHRASAYFVAKGITSKVVMISSDIPLLKGHMIDELISEFEGRDRKEGEASFYFSIIKREIMDKRFGINTRNYAQFRNHEVAIGDVHFGSPSKFIENKKIFYQLLGVRKSKFRLAKIVGFITLIKFALKRLTISGAEKRFSKITQSQVRTVFTSYPEVAMDADTIDQLEV